MWLSTAAIIFAPIILRPYNFEPDFVIIALIEIIQQIPIRGAPISNNTGNYKFINMYALYESCRRAKFWNLNFTTLRDSDGLDTEQVCEL
jgi:hypothetical protein